MTDKELRSLNRIELLEILYTQSKKIDELERENKKLQEKLESREIDIKNAGSLADASVKLCEVFEAAQKAADLYLENIRRRGGM